MGERMSVPVTVTDALNFVAQMAARSITIFNYETEPQVNTYYFVDRGEVKDIEVKIGEDKAEVFYKKDGENLNEHLVFRCLNG